MIEHFNLKARGPRVLLLLVLGGISLLFFLPSSSTDRAEKWRAEMRAKGEKLTAAELISDLVLETNDCMDVLTTAAPALSSFSAVSVRSTLPMPTNIPPVNDVSRGPSQSAPAPEATRSIGKQSGNSLLNKRIPTHRSSERSRTPKMFRLGRQV